MPPTTSIRCAYPYVRDLHRFGSPSALEFAPPMADTITAADRATLPIFDAEELTKAAGRVLGEARRALQELERLPLQGVSAESVLDAWDRVAIGLEDAFGPI